MSHGKTAAEEALPSRSYRLERDEPVADGLRRIAQGRVEKAAEALRDEENRAEAIHSARKDMKKLRALLRLCRKELGRERFETENRRYRDAGRLLSRSRDAEVKLETLAALQQRFGTEFPGGVHGPWALALEAERDEVVGVNENRQGAAVEQAVRAIEAGGAAIPGWPLRKETWGAVGPGLVRSYRRGRRAMASTIDEPNAENVHEWRKRAKDLVYQLRVVREAEPEQLGERIGEVKQLTDLLGDHHDLELLSEDLDRRALGRDDELRELIAWRQRELLKEALELGEGIYAGRPKDFKRRLHSYWSAWRPG